MKGVVQIEERGNISNDYITTVQDLSDILRIKQQGSCRELTYGATIPNGEVQSTSSVNASFINGANYGMFNNSMH
jgi:hypothetical protein